MLPRDFKPAALPYEPAKRVNRTGPATDVRRYGRSGNAELWKRTETEDEAGAKYNVERVRQPQHAHGDRSVARTAKDRIDHKQHHDRRVARQHNPREPNTVFDH